MAWFQRAFERKRQWSPFRFDRENFQVYSAIKDLPNLATGVAPGQWQAACEWQGTPECPVPVVITVDTTTSQSIDDSVELQQAYLVSPGTLTTNWTVFRRQGAIRVTYGMGQVTRRRIIDIRPGQYQLPPCNSVRLEYRVYNRSSLSNVGLPDVKLQLAIAPGTTTPTPAMPTVSGFAATTAPTPITMIFPSVRGQYAFRVGVEMTTLTVTADQQLTVNNGVHPMYYFDASDTATWSGPPDLICTAAGSVNIVKTGTATLNVFGASVCAW